MSDVLLILLPYLLLAIALLVFVLPLLLVYMMTHLPRKRVTSNPSDYNLKYEEVDFTSRDGTPLKGWYLPSQTDSDQQPEKDLIIVHGLGQNRSVPFSLLKPLLEEDNYNVFLFDLRAHGDSGGDLITFGYNEKEDVISAVDYLQTRHHANSSSKNNEIHAIGFSLGAASLLLAAAEDERIDKVVADSPFNLLRRESLQLLRRFFFPFHYVFQPFVFFFLRLLGIPPDRVDPLDHVADISPRPLFLIHAEQDRLIDSEETIELYERAKEPVQIWISSASKHASTLSEQPDKYLARVRDFFLHESAN